MRRDQNIVMVQNNNGGCGCGTLIGIFVLIGLAGVLLQKYGPIVMAIVGFFLGAWGGLKLSGVQVEELNALSPDDWDQRQWRAMGFLAVGGIMFAVAGWQMGAEMMKEMNDNKQALLRLLGKTA